MTGPTTGLVGYIMLVNQNQVADQGMDIFRMHLVFRPASLSSDVLVQEMRHGLFVPYCFQAGATRLT